MTRPSLLAQLSDPHIGADWGEGDPVPERLAAVIDAVRAMRPAPDAVLVSGDLADHASEAEYRQVRGLLPGAASGTVVRAAGQPRRPPWSASALRRARRLTASRCSTPSASGRFGSSCSTRRDQARTGARSMPPASTGSTPSLPQAPELPTLIAMHHPPLVTGVPAWDEIGLAGRGSAGTCRCDRTSPARYGGLPAGHVHRSDHRRPGRTSSCPDRCRARSSPGPTQHRRAARSKPRRRSQPGFAIPRDGRRRTGLARPTGRAAMKAVFLRHRTARTQRVRGNTEGNTTVGTRVHVRPVTCPQNLSPAWWTAGARGLNKGLLKP